MSFDYAIARPCSIWIFCENSQIENKLCKKIRLQLPGLHTGKLWLEKTKWVDYCQWCPSPSGVWFVYKNIFSNFSLSALALNVEISSATPVWTWSDVSRRARTAGTRRLYTPLLALTPGVTSSFCSFYLLVIIKTLVQGVFDGGCFVERGVHLHEVWPELHCDTSPQVDFYRC